MEMERRERNRRWSKRNTYIAGISVCGNDGAIKKCRARNISFEGMLVKPAIENVQKGSLLEIILPLQSTGRMTRHHTPVMVVHTSEKGMGLMFTRYDHELVRLITEITYGITK